MEILEKAIYQLDIINNANYKDKNNKKIKKTKLGKRYDLCNKAYLNYLKSYMSVTTHNPEIKDMTILDITSGTGILALSFLNAIYNRNVEYTLFLNDILFTDDKDQNIRESIAILESLNSSIDNVNVIINDYNILKDEEFSKFQALDNFLLIADPSISTNNANSFNSLKQFFSNETVNLLFQKAAYILFKDTTNIKKKFNQLFEYKSYDQLEEGLDNINLISKDKINILKILNKSINDSVEHVSTYCPEKLAKIYFFYGSSRIKVGEMNNFYYNGYTLEYSSAEYQLIEDENKKMKKVYDEISIEEISKKYEELKVQL